MRIGYSKTFPIPATGEWEKIWAEEEFEGTLEDAKKRWYAIKKEVQNFHYESKGHDEKIAVQNKGAVLDENGVAIAEIMLCKSIEELETYKLPATQSKAVKAAYNNRLKQLQKPTSNGMEQY